ncbi:hypothetical protein D3C78_1024760 [compost metagenome]
MSGQNIDARRMETVDVRMSAMGQDRVFHISGGTAHIGAIATAYLAHEGNAVVEVITLPGHRETELAAELAELAALSLKCSVAVVVGIHLDSPTREDIMAVVEEARTKMKKLLKDGKIYRSPI